MNDLIYVNKVDEVKLCLSNLTESQFRELKDFFSFRMKNFYFHPRFKTGDWNGMISYFDYNDQSIPIGLLPQFIKFCKQYGYKFKLNFDKEELYDDISDEQFEEFYSAIFKDTQYWPRDYQDQSIKKALRYRKGIIESATGCHSIGTKILMFNGTLKNVEDIIVGDKLMGPDGKERNVLRLIRNKGKMYKVIPTKGEFFVVNEDHVLHLQNMNLKYINKKDVYDNLTVNQYLSKSQYYKNKSKLLTNCNELQFNKFIKNTINLFPYFIGLYLGDGSVNSCSITTADKECVEEIYKQVSFLNGKIKIKNNRNSIAKTYYISFLENKNNIINKEFKKMGLNFSCRKNITKCENKFIPDVLKYANINDRYEVLAGLIDSDGSLCSSNYTITLKSERMIDDICFIARSLGFFVCKYIKFDKKYQRNYYRCSILGNIEKIPVRIERKKYKKKRIKNKSLNATSFKIESFGEDFYYGFELDSDHLYLTGDFIIHHNSGKSLNLYCIIRFLLGLEKRILFIVPNVGLVNQFFNDCKDYGWEDAETYVSTIFDGSKRINWNMPVIISTWQSIYKKTENFFKCFDAVLIDEVHGINDANSLQKCLKKATKAVYRIGTTGTIPDEIERKFAMFGYLGPLLFQQKSMELIDKGILAKISIVNLLLKYPLHLVDQAKQAKLDKNYDKEIDIINNYKDRNTVAFDFIFKNVNSKHNVLVLCKEIEHLKEVREFIEKRYKKEVFEIYGKVDGDTREEIRVGMEEKEGVVIVGTYKTMSTGINIKKIHHVVFAASYKSKITILQAIGRGLRTHESKDKLILWDIVDDLTWHSKFGDRQILHKNYVFDHWWLRLDFYKDQGYKYVTKILNINNPSDSYLQELS